MNNNNMIDWFSIDMQAMQAQYDEYLAAEEAHAAAVRQREACEEGYCTHERRLKKDGTPHRGIPCPQGFASYNEEISTGNSVFYDHHKLFWRAIGLEAKVDA